LNAYSASLHQSGCAWLSVSERVKASEQERERERARARERERERERERDLRVALRRHQEDIDDNDKRHKVEQARGMGELPELQAPGCGGDGFGHGGPEAGDAHLHTHPVALEVCVERRAALLVDGVDEHADDQLQDEETRHDHPQVEKQDVPRRVPQDGLLADLRRIHARVDVVGPLLERRHLEERLERHAEVVEVPEVCLC
jgi:hypothetical protein